MQEVWEKKKKKGKIIIINKKLTGKINMNKKDTFAYGSYSSKDVGNRRI